MDPNQTAIEKRASQSLFGGENAREEKWILRLSIALLICSIVICMLHAIGQVMFIAHMCA